MVEIKKFVEELPSEESHVQQLEDRVEALEHTLHQIKNWCNAYPVGVFHEPDWTEVKEKLGSMLLTQVSASNMRDVAEGISRIIEETEE